MENSRPGIQALARRLTGGGGVGSDSKSPLGPGPDSDRDGVEPRRSGCQAAAAAAVGRQASGHRASDPPGRPPCHYDSDDASDHRCRLPLRRARRSATTSLKCHRRIRSQLAGGSGGLSSGSARRSLSPASEISGRRGAGGVPGPRQVQVVGQHVSESELSLRLPPP